MEYTETMDHRDPAQIHGCINTSASIGANIQIPNARIERGECPDCGLKTHRIGRFKKPKPLTVPGYVSNGICLRCYPITTYNNSHRIQKILTDCEGSLVSNLTFGPGDHNLDQNNASNNHKDAPSLIYTEISENANEDEDEVENTILPLPPLSIEQAMERGKTFAEREELSVRFSEEDMGKYKSNIHIFKAEVVHDNINEKALEPNQNHLKTKKNRAKICKVSSTFHPRNNYDMEEIPSRNLDLLITDENKQKDIQPSLPHPMRSFSLPRSNYSPDKIDDQDFLELTFKRSQSEGDYMIQNNLQHFLALNEQKQHDQFPQIPPPPYPIIESKKSNIPPQLARYNSEYSNISMRATNGFNVNNNRDEFIRQFYSTSVCAEEKTETFSEPNEINCASFDDGNYDETNDNIDKIKELKLKRFSTAPVEREVINTGVKKMVSFRQSRAPYSTDCDLATSSSISWGSDTYSKSSQTKPSRLTPILRNMVGSGLSSNSNRVVQHNLRRQHEEIDYAFEGNSDSSSSADIMERTKINEKVKKMRDEDDSFIERKIQELSEIEHNQVDEDKTYTGEKILKTRLTQLGSSTSRDLDHAFIAHQLRKINLQENSLGDSGRNSKLASNALAETGEGHTRNNLVSFFQRNIENFASTRTRYDYGNSFDPNRASLVSDDDDDDMELLMNRRRLGLNNAEDSIPNGIGNTANPMTSYVKQINYVARAHDSYSKSSSVCKKRDEKQKMNDSLSKVLPNQPSEGQFDKFVSEKKQEDNKYLDESAQVSSSTVLENLLKKSQSGTETNIQSVLKLMSNESNPLNTHALLLGLKFIQTCATSQIAKKTLFDYDGVSIIVQKMWKYLENTEILMAACGAIWTISTNCDERQKTMLASSGAAEAVMCIMQSHIHFVELQVKACGVLGSFCLEENKCHLISMGVVQLLATVLKRYPKHTSLHIWGIRALWGLCRDTVSGESLIEAEKADCDQLVILALNGEYENELWEWGFRLLWSMSNNYTVANRMLEKNSTLFKIISLGLDQQGCDKVLICGLISNMASAIRDDVEDIEGVSILSLLMNVIFVMNSNSNNEGLQVVACSALSKFALKNEANQCAIISCDGVKIVHNAMKKFRKNENIERNACSILLLCSLCDGGKNDFTHEIMEHLVERFTESLSAKKLKLVEYYCAIVASLATESSRHHSISSCGVIPIIVDVMACFAEVESIQDASCILICNLLHTASIAESFIDLGVIKSLITAMKIHKDIFSIQEAACISLWRLSALSPKCASDLMMNNGIEGFVTLMQTHDQSEKAQCVASGALWCLSSIEQADISDQFIQAMIKSNGIETLICAMFTFPSAITILKNSFGTLSALSAFSSIAKILLANGGLDALIDTMRHNISCKQILIDGCIIFRNVFISCPCTHIGSSGPAQVILRTMREHSHDEIIQQHACCALWSLTSSGQRSKVTIDVLAGGGMDLIMGVLEHKEWDSQTQIYAREALESLIT